MAHSFRKLQKSRWLLIIPFILTAMTLYLFDIYEVVKPRTTSRTFDLLTNESKSGFLINTPGCRILYMNPFDKAVLKYFKKQKHFKCSKTKPLVQSNQTSVWLVQGLFENYNITDANFLKCCYRPFWRTEVGPEVEIDVDDKISKAKKCIGFVNSTNIEHEFVEVSCTYKKTQIYKDFHAFIVPKSPKGYTGSEKKNNGVSVLIVGIDAVSRLNFHRQMPRTSKLVSQLNAIQFLGYNKVHDNTFPNLIPLLSGFSVTELQKECWPNKKDFFDQCPFIWKSFNERGFLTGWGEDACWMGTFNYEKNGFVNSPTDYYIKPYIKMNEDIIGHSQKLNAKFCVGARFANQVLCDYIHKFSENLTRSDKKFWGLFWGSSLTHDFFNPPPDTDDMYYKLFLKLNNSNVLEKTVVFLLSDHGIRWGAVRETLQGRLEERLPFLFILLPSWFREKYTSAVSNLVRNTRLLTTPYDVHETMLDLMDLSNLEDHVDGDHKWRKQKLTAERGISLFSPISRLRTCAAAGIPAEWCTCHVVKTISVDDDNVIRAANVLVDHINDLLLQYIQCAHLTLKKIHHAWVESPSNSVMDGTKAQVLDYLVTVITEPGGGKFEATVRYSSFTNTMRVHGYVSRINLYGTQSRCISDFHLKLYCFCG